MIVYHATNMMTIKCNENHVIYMYVKEKARTILPITNLLSFSQEKNDAYNSSHKLHSLYREINSIEDRLTLHTYQQLWYKRDCFP